MKKQLRAVYRQRLQAACERMNLADEMIVCLSDAVNHINKDDLEPSWRHTGLIPFNKSLIVNNAKNCCGEIDLTNQSTITDEAKKATMEVIQHSLGSSDTIECHDFQPTKQFYTAQDIFEEKMQKVAEKQAKTKKSKRATVNGDDVASLNGAPVKKQRIRTNVCCFEQHETIDRLDRKVYKGKTYCDICREYFLCNKCYHNVPEELLLHQENCAFISSKIKKIKEVLGQQPSSNDANT